MLEPCLWQKAPIKPIILEEEDPQAGSSIIYLNILPFCCKHQHALGSNAWNKQLFNYGIMDGAKDTTYLPKYFHMHDNAQMDYPWK